MHRTSKGGTYRLDRRFPGVGRIALASGATTVAEFKKRDALLTRLYDRGRFDLLRAIRDRTYTVTEVYAADREGRLDQLMVDGGGDVLDRPLWDTVESWLGFPLWSDAGDGKHKRPDKTRQRYGVSFKALKLRGPLGERATVSDLPPPRRGVEVPHRSTGRRAPPVPSKAHEADSPCRDN